MFKKLITLLSAIIFSAVVVPSFAVSNNNCPQIFNEVNFANAEINPTEDFWELFIPQDSQSTINGRKIIGAVIYLGKSRFSGKPSSTDYANELKKNEGFKLKHSQKGSNYQTCRYQDEKATITVKDPQMESYIIFKLN